MSNDERAGGRPGGIDPDLLRTIASINFTSAAILDGLAINSSELVEGREIALRRPYGKNDNYEGGFGQIYPLDDDDPLNIDDGWNVVFKEFDTDRFDGSPDDVAEQVAGRVRGLHEALQLEHDADARLHWLATPAVVGTWTLPDGRCEVFSLMANLSRLRYGQFTRDLYRKPGHQLTPARLDLCSQLAARVHELHAHGLVHHDLKQQNIMVSKDGTDLQIIDLDHVVAEGSADAATPDSGEWLPPATRRNEDFPGRAHRSADLWALAMAIGNITCGWPLFSFLSNRSEYTLDTYAKQVRDGRYPAWPQLPLDAEEASEVLRPEFGRAHTTDIQRNVPGPVVELLASVVAAGVDYEDWPTTRDWTNALGIAGEPPRITSAKFRDRAVPVGSWADLEWDTQWATEVAILDAGGRQVATGLPASGSFQVPVESPGCQRFTVTASGPSGVAPPKSSEPVWGVPVPELTQIQLPGRPLWNLPVQLSVPQTPAPISIPIAAPVAPPTVPCDVASALREGPEFLPAGMAQSAPVLPYFFSSRPAPVDALRVPNSVFTAAATTDRARRQGK